MKKAQKIQVALVSILLSLWTQAEADPREIQFSSKCESASDLASISFVGDILVHEALYRAVVSGSKNFNQIWRRTDGLMGKAEFSVGNLEGPAAMGVDRHGRDHGDVGFIYDEVVYSGSNFSFNYHPRILSDLKTSGYDLLTLANNHALDRGSLGIDKTLAAARNLALPIVGVRDSVERNGEFYRIVAIKNLRVAFLGCTEMSNGNVDKKDQLLFCYKNPERILEIIRKVAARSDVDALIVLPHWGDEYNHTPDGSQKSYARRYLEAGATAVIGSHPHVLQPWEKYVTQDGRETLIAYSLGNFVAGQAGLARKTGVVVYLGLGQDSSGRTRIIGASYTPTYRDGYEVYPVLKSKDVLDHAGKFFGFSRRLEVGGELMPHLCRKDNHLAEGRTTE